MVTCSMAFRPLCLCACGRLWEQVNKGSFIHSGPAMLLFVLSFSLPRIGVQEMRQNSDKCFCGSNVGNVLQSWHKYPLSVRALKHSGTYWGYLSNSRCVYMNGIIGRSVACEMYSLFLLSAQVSVFQNHFQNRPHLIHCSDLGHLHEICR